MRRPPRARRSRRSWPRRWVPGPRGRGPSEWGGTPPLLPLFPAQCSVLKEKLDSLLKTLDDESQASSSLPTPPPTIAEEAEDGDGAGSGCGSGSTGARAGGSACPARPQIFRPREQLMLRANSLKKAIRQIIEHTEKGSRAWAPAWGQGRGLLVRGGARHDRLTRVRTSPRGCARERDPEWTPAPRGHSRLVEGPAQCLVSGAPLPVRASPWSLSRPWPCPVRGGLSPGLGACVQEGRDPGQRWWMKP